MTKQKIGHHGEPLRTKSIRINLTPDQYAAIVGDAKRIGLAPAVLARRAVLSSIRKGKRNEAVN